MAEVYRPDPNSKKPRPSANGKGSVGKKKKKKLSPAGVAMLVIFIVAVLAVLFFAFGQVIIDFFAGMVLHQDKTEEAKHYVTEAPEQTETLDTSLPTVELPPDLPEGKNNEGLPLICNTREVKNYLLIGVDARGKGTQTGLSDTMILVSVNTRTKQILLTSIERDLVVKIPGKGQNKLNAAHAMGGPDLLMETLKENFNIEVDQWFRVDFYNFVDIVDAVGGLDVEMTASEIHYMNYYLLEINELYNRAKGTDNLPEKEGTYHLNGYQTLAFCRNRYTDSDFGRMGRQRKVIDLVMQKAKSDLGNAASLLNTLLPMVTTNMTHQEVVAAMNEAIGYLSYDLVKGSLPADSDWVSGNADLGSGPRSVVLFRDKKDSFNKLYTAIYGEEPV